MGVIKICFFFFFYHQYRYYASISIVSTNILGLGDLNIRTAIQTTDQIISQPNSWPGKNENTKIKKNINRRQGITVSAPAQRRMQKKYLIKLNSGMVCEWIWIGIIGFHLSLYNFFFGFSPHFGCQLINE